MTFITPCFHPNVDQYGNICLDILKVRPADAAHRQRMPPSPHEARALLTSRKPRAKRARLSHLKAVQHADSKLL